MSPEFDGSYENLINRLTKRDGDAGLVSRAYEKAFTAHKGQFRQSGEPYIMHPLGVANILLDIDMDKEAIAAGLLHDVIEDTEIGYDDIKAEFGETVASLVEGVTKLDKIKFVSKEERQIENLRKMFLSMATDIRVIIIKLADRLHNMRTLKHMSTEKQLEKAKETLEVYAPLAHRLGIQKIKWELEDLSLRYLDSVAYYEISDGIKKKKEERDQYISGIMDTLRRRIGEMGIWCTISGRAKHFYSIYRKMYTQNKTLDEIYDLFAARVIVNTVSDCYAVLGLVHDLYKPIPGRFKDYIAMPKPNMYQSLHTTVMTPEGHPFEIQIRTVEMHQVAEHGVAAHWKYKEGVSGQTDLDEKLAWVRDLLEIQNDANDSQEFMNALKIDLFADEVFVFTPKGDVFNMPNGATPIDFAFKVHSAVGYRMIGAKVNSKIVPLDYVLQNGDIIEILTTSAVHGPSLDWIKMCKTSQARNKINQWFKKEKREENLERGKELVEKEIKKNGYRHEDIFKNEYVKQMLRRYNFSSVEDMYVGVGCGGITAARIVGRLIEYNKEIQKALAQQEAEALLEQQGEAPGAPKDKNGVVVKGIDGCLVRFSKCCNPVPGDKIIGFITRGRGVSVHRVDCANIALENLTDEEKGRIIECEWAGAKKAKYQCYLQIEAGDRQGVLADITNAITELKIPVLSLYARKTKDNNAIMDVTLEISDTQQISEVVKRLHRVPGVYEIVRAQQ